MALYALECDDEFLSFSNGFLIRHYSWRPLERRVSESASIRLKPPRERRSVTARVLFGETASSQL